MVMLGEINKNHISIILSFYDLTINLFLFILVVEKKFLRFFTLMFWRSRPVQKDSNCNFEF